MSSNTWDRFPSQISNFDFNIQLQFSLQTSRQSHTLAQVWMNYTLFSSGSLLLH